MVEFRKAGYIPTVTCALTLLYASKYSLRFTVYVTDYIGHSKHISFLDRLFSREFYQDDDGQERAAHFLFVFR